MEPMSIMAVTTFAGAVNAILEPLGVNVGDVSSEFICSTLSDGTRQGIRSAITGFAPKKKQQINHDLQRAFRDAVCEAIYDIGGKPCFPSEWARERDIPSEAVIGWPTQDNISPHDGKFLPDIREASPERQLCRALWAVGRAVKDETLFPLAPPLDEQSLPASAYYYLQPRTRQVEPDAGQNTGQDDAYRYIATSTSEKLSNDFFEYLLNVLREAEDTAFAPLLSQTNEAAYVCDHLRRHLLDRTLIQFGELLKSDEYTASWRAFNRLLLEGLRDGVADLKEGQQEIQQSQHDIQQTQQEILARLHALLALPQGSDAVAGWNNNLATLVQEVGRIKKRQNISFVALLQQMQGQHSEVMEGISGVQETLQRLETLLIDAQAIENPYDTNSLPNPYLGLQSFTYEHRHIYAGREKQAKEAIDKLTAQGGWRVLLFITGASGSGKSSFAQAGIIPALETYYHQRHRTVRQAVIRPSTKPIDMLIDGLMQLNIPTSPLQETFACHLQTHTADNQINVIIIDQFEELFTQSERQQREFFISILTTLPPFGEIRTHLIATIRSDYLPELFEHQALYNEAKRGVDLRVMTEDELRTAILRPLQHTYGGRKKFEPELLERLVADASAESTYLPLLQVTLEDLWKRGSLKLGAYDNLTDAIRRRAEEVYAASLDGRPRTPDEQDALMAMFLGLVEVSLDSDTRRDVRRRRTTAELTHNRPEWVQTIDELATARLLSKGLEHHGDQQTEVVDIIHESLINNWKRLREAIDERRSQLQQRARFELAYAEWQEKGKNEQYLLMGVRLSEAENLDRANDVALRKPEAQEFLKQSKDKREAEQQREIERQRQVNRRLFGALGVAVVLLVIAIGASLWATQEAEHAREAEAVAEEQAEEAFANYLASQSGNLEEREPDLSMLLALQSNNQVDTAQSQHAISERLQAFRYLSTILSGHSSWVMSVAYSPDGRRLASGSYDGTVKVWDVGSDAPHEVATLSGHSSWVSSVAYSPDGRRLASGSSDGTVKLWDVGSDAPQEVATLSGHSDWVRSVAYSPDGRRLASGSDDGTVKVWDVGSDAPQEVATLSGHSSSVYSVAYSPDGRRLASGSSDGTVKVWDVGSDAPQEVATLSGHSSSVYSVAYSPDGRRLASGSYREVKVWDVSVDSWKAQLCRKVNRNLTLEEWRIYMGSRPYKKTCPDLPEHPSVAEAGGEGSPR